jgi:hypothetical protein
VLLQWFEDLGGFEKAENIQHFVAWSIKAVELFGSRITYWATFNEPTVSSSSSSSMCLQQQCWATFNEPTVSSSSSSSSMCLQQQCWATFNEPTVSSSSSSSMCLQHHILGHIQRAHGEQQQQQYVPAAAMLGHIQRAHGEQQQQQQSSAGKQSTTSSSGMGRQQHCRRSKHSSSSSSCSRSSRVANFAVLQGATSPAAAAEMHTALSSKGHYAQCLRQQGQRCGSRLQSSAAATATRWCCVAAQHP